MGKANAKLTARIKYCYYEWWLVKARGIYYERYTMQKIMLIIMLLMSSIGCNSLDAAAHNVPDSYHGQQIRVGTVDDLIKQASPLSEQVRIGFDAWSQEDAKRALLKQLLHFRFANVNEYRAKMAQDNALIAQNGLSNESKWNYVFGVPKLGYHIKIAGPVNRIQSALMEHGIWPGQQPSPDVLARILSGETPTYQTASRAAYFLILKEFLNRTKLKHITIPETHLVYYPGVPENVRDDYVLILEKDLPADLVKITSGLAKNLSNEMLSELIQTIIAAGLWSINDNLFLDKKEKIYVVDLEQPNNSAAQDFFHKDKARYYGNINAGLEGLLQLLQGDNNRLRLAKIFIESNPIVQSADYNPRYKRELEAMLQRMIPEEPVQHATDLSAE